MMTRKGSNPGSHSLAVLGICKLKIIDLEKLSLETA